jgi:hypothetical protein
MARPKKQQTPIEIPINQGVPAKVVYEPHNLPAQMCGTSYAAQEFTHESLASIPYNRAGDDCGASSELSYLKYNNLVNRTTPYSETNGFWNIRNSVVLCQTAWREVPVFNQTIETMTILANTNIVWRGGSDKCKKFLKVWWNKIRGHNLNEQLLRELFRSSNVFVYRYDGGIKSNKINKFVLGEETTEKIKDKELEKSEAAKTIDIPVKYEVLNPADICCASNYSLSFTPSYYRFFDQSTKQRLLEMQKNKDIPIRLDEELLKFLKGNISAKPLEPEKISAIFYHKQDYEPFAMPMGYPVLEDINLKLEFKKCDTIVSKTVESIIMLVTHGAEPDKGGMNPILDTALKTLFSTKQTGRTLISDYTTKIDFIIPDLKKVIGPEKYLKLDQDINDGLMNIFFGDQKFANIMVKLRVFVAILTYAQELLINEFLQKEINRVCKLVGYGEEEIPTIKFSKLQLEDPSQSQRIIAQFSQLGLLSAEETFEAVKTGIFPTKEESEKSQENYKKLRDKEYYFPLVGGSQEKEATVNGRPAGSSGISKKKVNPGFKGGSSGSFDVIKFKRNILLANEVVNEIEKEYKAKFHRKKLIDKDQEIIKIVSTHLFTNEAAENWKESIGRYLNENLPEPNIENIGIIEEIKEENGTDEITSALLMWSKI